MYLHLNCLKAHCLASGDGILDNYSEFYWTWSVYSDDKSSDEIQVAKGFSAGCPIDTGYEMNDSDSNYRELNDPKFTIELPEVANGETKKVRVELQCWESDHSSIDVKKAFSNDALQTMIGIYEKNLATKKQIIDEFYSWIDDDDNQFIEAIVSAGVIDAGYLTIAKSLLPLCKIVYGYIQSNSDDLIGFFAADLFITNTNGKISYKWVFNNGSEYLLDAEGKFYKEATFTQYNNKNSILLNILLEIISSDPLGLK